MKRARCTIERRKRKGEERHTETEREEKEEVCHSIRIVWLVAVCSSHTRYAVYSYAPSQVSFRFHGLLALSLSLSLSLFVPRVLEPRRFLERSAFSSTSRRIASFAYSSAAAAPAPLARSRCQSTWNSILSHPLSPRSACRSAARAPLASLTPYSCRLSEINLRDRLGRERERAV